MAHSLRGTKCVLGGKAGGAWRWDCLVQTSYLGGEEVEGASQSRGHVIGKGGPE